MNVEMTPETLSLAALALRESAAAAKIAAARLKAQGDTHAAAFAAKAARMDDAAEHYEAALLAL